MKNVIFASVIAAVVAVVASNQTVQASAWGTISGFFADTIESKLFAIEAQGKNIRGYIFKSPVNGKWCIATASSVGSGLSCDWSK